MGNNNVVGAGAVLAMHVWIGRDSLWEEHEPMIERYIVVATPAYADFTQFQSAATTVTRGDDGTKAEDKTKALPPFLREAIEGGRTRGTNNRAGIDWGLTYFDLQLVSPEAYDKLVKK